MMEKYGEGWDEKPVRAFRSLRRILLDQKYVLTHEFGVERHAAVADGHGGGRGEGRARADA